MVVFSKYSLGCEALDQLEKMYCPSELQVDLIVQNKGIFQIHLIMVFDTNIRKGRMCQKQYKSFLTL